MDTAKLIHESWRIAEEKGFHADYQERGYLQKKLMLAISELGEAIESDRTGKRANLSQFGSKYEAYLREVHVHFTSKEQAFQEAFQETIKDTFEDELADALIRIFDYCGIIGVKELTLHRYASPNIELLYQSAGAILFYLSRDIMQAYSMPETLSTFYSNLFHFCVLRKINIRKHVELKLRFNSLRPPRHGKRY